MASKVKSIQIDNSRVAEKNSAKEAWHRLDAERNTSLDRKKDCAELTIPSLIPRDGQDGNSELPTPYQSLGARGVNTLASKMVLALFPPNLSFFKFVLDETIINELEAVQEGAREQIEKALLEQSKIVTEWIENNNIRPSLFLALKYLICAGDTLVRVFEKEEKIKVYRPDQFVIQRDGRDKIILMIIKESIDPRALKGHARELAMKDLGCNDSGQSNDTLGTDKTCVFTVIQWIDKKYEVWQEIAEEKIKDIIKYSEEDLPYIAPRWSKIDGEDYGRGHVEDYLGDLRTYEALTQLIVKGGGALAKVLFLVNPSGSTRIKSLAKSETGAILPGNAADVTVVQAANKATDFNVALATAQQVEGRLSQAFLLTNPRQAERVTAEEIRIVAQDLEDALGGIFSLLSDEFQLPLLRIIIGILKKKKKLQPLPQADVHPRVVTGVEALGRGHDLTNLTTFTNILASIPEDPYIKRGNLIARLGNSLGIDPDGLIRTDEEVQEIQQQQAIQQAASNASGPVAGQLAKGFVEQNQT